MQLYVCKLQVLDVGMLQDHLNIHGLQRNCEWVEGLAPPRRITGRILAELVGTVALVAGRRQIAKIDGVERIKRLGQVVVVGFPFAVMLALDIADAAERALPSLVGGHEGMIVIVDVANLGAQYSEAQKRLGI
ncbi:hypothetical protein D3C81_1308300 [compost metagenome]